MQYTSRCPRYANVEVHSPPIPSAIYRGCTPPNSQNSPSRSRPSRFLELDLPALVLQYLLAPSAISRGFRFR